jgi:hypothetical protein
VTNKPVDWPWMLTRLSLACLCAHFLVLIGAGLLLPAEWSLATALSVLGLLVLGIVLSLAVVWLDYRSSARRSSVF